MNWNQAKNTSNLVSVMYAVKFIDIFTLLENREKQVELVINKKYWLYNKNQLNILYKQ